VESDHTLKSLTEVVNVPVTVRDEDQRLISDLKREDFSLAEDGRAQLIKYFSRTRDVPLTLGLMVDTTVCQDEGLPLEKELAQEFIRHVMQPGDQGFVQHFGSGVEFLQHLTSGVDRLAGAIGEAIVHGTLPRIIMNKLRFPHQMSLNNLEQRLKTGGAKMTVVRERAGQAEAAHHLKGGLIDNACISCFASFVGEPGRFPIGGSWFDECFIGSQ